jgi:hypothetical protein
MQTIYTVIEFRNGLLVSAESFTEKADAQDHFVGVVRGKGKIAAQEIENGHFATVQGSSVEKAHIAYFVVSTI